MSEPLTMSAEREAEIRRMSLGQFAGIASGEVLAAMREAIGAWDAERAAHKRTQAVQDRISKWADATFGPATAEVSFRRFDEEDAEFTLENQDPEEAADIVICLFRWAAVKGVDLLAETEKKLAKCMARDWDLNGDGTGHRKGAATKQVLGLREQLRHSKEVSTKLLEALKNIGCQDTDVCRRGYGTVLCARCAAIALTERPEDLASSANTLASSEQKVPVGIIATHKFLTHKTYTGNGCAVCGRESADHLASSDGSPADAVPSMKGTDGR